MRSHRRGEWKAWISTCLILGAAFLPYLTTPIAAQTTTGGLRGVVMDVTGAIVPGATVVAKNVATGVEHRTTATSEGIYTIPRIPPGRYDVKVEAQGFKAAEVTGVEVGVGKDTVVDFRLEPGAITEVVTVTGGGEVLIERDTAQISATIQSRRIQDLPINVAGGGLDRVVLLLPGVRTGFGNVNSNGVTLSVNGNRARSNNFTIDGVDNNDLSIGGPNYFVQNPDLVQEYQVITNNFSAEYGRNQGAIVNIVSKSGTNEFHGTLAWYHRDRKLWDSRTNLEKRAGQKDLLPNLVNVFDYT
ncbi:MAG: Plug and carboxypeptidase regulatory-like domain-containing protein, partial [Blastocatellia bacterium]|nr:Plug and carboxypeptidase regulatory-like domain-containing protein [Blastocatellia bacterium]